MKLWVYESDNGSVVFSNRPKDFGMVFIGTLDLDIKPEKKWVKHEAQDVMLDFKGNVTDKIFAWVPTSARNVKVTYEVEE